MKKNIYFFGKIFLIIVVSLIISTNLSKTIFLANTPRLNPYFFRKITPNNLKQNFLVFLENLSKQKSSIIGVNKEETIRYLEKNLNAVAPGIRANTYKNFTVVEYDLNKVKWKKVEYILNNGRKIEIKYPEGTDPPPKELFEK